MTDNLIEGFNTPTPDKVPGYPAALAAGKLPVVPANPPQLLPGVTAGQFVLHRVYVFLAGFILTVILANVAESGVVHDLAFVPVVASMVWFFIGIPKFLSSTLRETRMGYATSKFIFTNAQTRRANRAQRWNGGRVGWDFGGVWYLKNNGSVVTAPDTSKFAPGYYPSPNAAGQFELWTGKAWNGGFRDAADVPAAGVQNR